MWWCLLLGCLSASAQVAVDQWRADGSRYICSAQATLYDNYFHTARFAIAAIADSLGLVDFELVVTYDEGLLHISQGDTLALTLRGGRQVILTTKHDVRRADIIKRHYRDHNDYLITCHYTLPVSDMVSLYKTRSTKLTKQTDQFIFHRRLDGFQQRFTRLLAAVYNRLNIH